jgi:Tfp pilus assembly protein PilW
MRERAQRGFTIVEIMVSLLIASLIVIMLLGIFSRVSFAYREQQKIVGLTRLLSGAREALEYDASQAGLGMSQGFRVADGTTNLRSPIRVVNSSTDADEIAFYYADMSKQAMVTVTAANPTTVTIDDNPGFADGEVVVMSTANYTTTTGLAATDAKRATYIACVLTVASSTTTSITFTDPGNSNAHCTGGAVGMSTMIYKFVGHYWRIDTSTAARAALGVLQLDPNGALDGVVDANFTDQAYGVVNLQAATYFYDADTDATDTDDPDADGARDWYSSTEQDTFTQNALTFANTPLAVTVSVVARTAESVEGVSTANSPNLTDATNTDNNNVGDQASFSLPSATLDAYKGNHVYRYITFQVNLRNMGVGL